MAATYARTVATGPVSVRAGTVWRSAAVRLVFRAGDAPPRAGWRSAAWFAAAGGVPATMKWYAAKPSVTASASPSTNAQFGRRRAGAWAVFIINYTPTAE